MIIGDIDSDINKFEADRADSLEKIKDNKYLFDSLKEQNRQL